MLGVSRIREVGNRGSYNFLGKALSLPYPHTRPHPPPLVSELNIVSEGKPRPRWIWPRPRYHIRGLQSRPRSGEPRPRALIQILGSPGDNTRARSSAATAVRHSRYFSTSWPRPRSVCRDRGSLFCCNSSSSPGEIFSSSARGPSPKYSLLLKVMALTFLT